jgi:hypothetical protein
VLKRCSVEEVQFCTRCSVARSAVLHEVECCTMCSVA